MSRRTPRGTVIELGGEPRINFLPGEIQERKDARRRRRSLFMLVVLVGILCAIGYVYAAQFAAERQALLDAEQNTALELLSQQGEYAEARALADKVALTGTAITHSTATEIFWRPLIQELDDALLPMLESQDVGVRQWSLKGLSATQLASPTETLFPIMSVAHVELDVVARNLSALSGFIEALTQVPGVISVEIGSTSLIDGASYYGSVLTVRYSDDVYEGRFAQGWEPGMTPQPTTAPTPAPEPTEEPEDGDVGDVGDSADSAESEAGDQ